MVKSIVKLIKNPVSMAGALLFKAVKVETELFFCWHRKIFAEEVDLVHVLSYGMAGLLKGKGSYRIRRKHLKWCWHDVAGAVVGDFGFQQHALICVI